MPIQVWLARMERPLTEQEYGDMMALLPDARRERLEKLCSHDAASAGEISPG